MRSPPAGSPRTGRGGDRSNAPSGTTWPLPSLPVSPTSIMPTRRCRSRRTLAADARSRPSSTAVTATIGGVTAWNTDVTDGVLDRYRPEVEAWPGRSRRARAAGRERPRGRVTRGRSTSQNTIAAMVNRTDRNSPTVAPSLVRQLGEDGVAAERRRGTRARGRCRGGRGAPAESSPGDATRGGIDQLDAGDAAHPDLLPPRVLARALDQAPAGLVCGELSPAMTARISARPSARAAVADGSPAASAARTSSTTPASNIAAVRAAMRRCSSARSTRRPTMRVGCR